MKRLIFLSSAVLFVVFSAGAALLAARPAGAVPGGTIDGALRSPVRIALMDNGPVLVTDYAAGSVCMVNRKTLEVLRCFPVKGRPLGVAWARGRVFVGNETAGTVEIYNPGGKQQFSFGSGAVKAPNDIAVDEKGGKLFVVDGHEKNIKIFDLEGRLLFTITGDAAGDGRLVNPTAVALDLVRGEVLVSDYGDPAASFPARIRIYDYAGAFIAAISGRTGGFSRPQGLIMDGDRIFAADGMLGQVLVFDRTTRARIKALGSFGEGAGQLMLPLGVTIDPASGDVYVTNNRKGRIECFREGGTIP